MDDTLYYRAMVAHARRRLSRPSVVKSRYARPCWYALAPNRPTYAYDSQAEAFASLVAESKGES